MRVLAGDVAEGIDGFERTGREIEPQDGVTVDVVGPHLAVDVGMARHHHRLLHGVAVLCWRDREKAKMFRLAIEIGRGGRKHPGRADDTVSSPPQTWHPGREYR